MLRTFYLITSFSLMTILLGACTPAKKAVPQQMTPTASQPVPAQPGTPQSRLQGTWNSSCYNDGETSHSLSLTFDADNTPGQLRVDITTYVDSDCRIQPTTQSEYPAYVVGAEPSQVTGALTLDLDQPTDFVAQFNIVALVGGNNLYLGAASATQDGSSAALRPTQLQSDPFVRQP